MIDTTLNESKKNPESVVVRINARKLVLGFAIFAIVLVLISLIAQFIKYFGGVEKAYGLIPAMDVDRELSVPSIFSVQLLFILVVILEVITLFKINTRDQFRIKWAILPLGFLIMAFDEGASIHELVVTPLRNLLGGNLPDYLTFVWVLPGMLIIVLLVISYFKFLFNLPARLKKGILVSGGIYLCGLLAMELVGGYVLGMYGIQSLVYNVVVTIEESLEMAGLVLAIYTFLDYFKTDLRGITLKF